MSEQSPKYPLGGEDICHARQIIIAPSILSHCILGCFKTPPCPIVSDLVMDATASRLPPRSTMALPAARCDRPRVYCAMLTARYAARRAGAPPSRSNRSRPAPVSTAAPVKHKLKRRSHAVGRDPDAAISCSVPKGTAICQVSFGRGSSDPCDKARPSISRSGREELL